MDSVLNAVHHACQSKLSQSLIHISYLFVPKMKGMVPIMSLTETIKRVCLYTGNVSHLVDYSAPPMPGRDKGREASLCNLVPIWPGVWYNSGSADELPLCKTCETVQGGMSGDRT